MLDTPEPSPPPRLASQPRAVAWLRAAMFGALVGPALLLAYVGWTSYHRTIEEGRARLSGLAQIAQEQAQRIVETNEVISRAIAAALQGHTNQELVEARPALHALLRGLTRDLRQLQSVWIWDAQGRPIATNLRADVAPGLNVSDRDYFMWARSTAETGWYVTGPLRSRTTGQLFFDFVKRRESPDGGFAGAVSVSLLPEYFTEFFGSRLGGDAGLSLSLVRADGTIISRYPAAEESGRLGDGRLLAAMQRGEAQGATQGESAVDGHWGYGSYRRVGDLPLYTFATARQDLLLAPWRAWMSVLTLFTLPLALGLAGLSWFALRRVRREHAIALAHQEEYEQRTRAEEALRQAQKMEALGRLTGGVAHDFNNVLMVVQSSVALARKLEERGKPAKAALDPIDRAVANGAQLTRQLLAIARRQPLEVRNVDLRELVGPVSQLLSSTLGSRVRVECEVARDTGAVTVDQAELELALINLCINARDAMPDGGQIRIQASPAAPPADAPPLTPWVRISVADTGEGIPAELLGKVTEPFFTTKPYGKGTGLGLSQVHSFVQQSGGRMAIESRLGQGTTVSILLPSSVLAPAAAKPEPDAAVALEANVALVEDNDGIAASLVQLLEHSGSIVSRYTSAEAALAALAGGASGPDAILSDISLGGPLTGIDLARQVNARFPHIPVVLMTGYTDRLQEAVALGLRVLAKPAAPEQVLRALADAMAAQRAAVAGKH